MDNHVEVEENTVGNDEASDNTVPNSRMQDFHVSSNTSVSVGESLINSYNVTDEAVIENL